MLTVDFIFDARVDKLKKKESKFEVFMSTVVSMADVVAKAKSDKVCLDDALRACLRIVRDPSSLPGTVLPIGCTASAFAMSHVHKIASTQRQK